MAPYCTWTKYLKKMGKSILLNMHPLENLSKLGEQNQGFENVAIACPDDDSCTYKFRVTRDIESPDQYHRRTHCNFTVTSPPGGLGGSMAELWPDTEVG